jgi:hypothetical protein
VVLLADNDGPGWDRVKRVACNLWGEAEWVKIPTLPGLESGDDIIDWLGGGHNTKDDLLALVEQTQPEGRPVDFVETGSTALPTSEGKLNRGSDKDVKDTGDTPVDAVENVQSVRMGFPVEVFPPDLARFAESTAKALPCPVDTIGCSMLAVLGLCIGRKRGINIKGTWTEYPQLWVANIGRSGKRKSPALTAAMAPLHKHQEALAASYREEKKEYSSLPREQQAKTPRPKLKQTHTTNATIEAIHQLLEANPNGVMYFADELMGWLRGHGQYKRGKGSDLQEWLQIWSGVPAIINRKSLPEPLVINHPFVPILGGFPPDAIPDLIDSAREDGKAARFLLSFPAPLKSAEWTEDTPECTEAYETVCRCLLALRASDVPIRLSDEAKSRWVEWINQHRKEQVDDALGAVWAKAEGYCLRLTLILFLTKEVYKLRPMLVCGTIDIKDTLIDLESIEGGIKLIEYFKSHAKYVYDYAANKVPTLRMAKAIRHIKKLVARGKQVSPRLIQQYRIASCMRVEQARELLSDLVALGYGTFREGTMIFSFTEGESTFQQTGGGEK